MDTLQPEGPNARTIDNLINPVFVVAAVIFVAVEAMAVIFVIRYRYRERSEDPVQIHGSTRLEVGWTLIPALILLAVAIPTIATIFKLARKPANALNVTVTAYQWWWQYDYPELGVRTINELHMPRGRPVELTLVAADVIHSFWIPKLGGKTDVVPGRDNRMHLIAEEPGEYLGQCAEFCGDSHANMRAKAIAMMPQDFDAWVAGQRAAAVTATAGTPAEEGLTVFNQRGCGSCHTVAGLSTGTIGPNLTHFATRTTFAGSMFDNNDANLRRWLSDPLGVKPGNKMLIPGGRLSADEVTKLIAYLNTLR